jgi:hypothetical protein
MSDHFWGPRAIAGPAADITDRWAFPSPQRLGHLVMRYEEAAAWRAGLDT